MKHQKIAVSETMSMLCTPVRVKLMLVCKTDQKKMKHFIGGQWPQYVGLSLVWCV